VPYDPDPVCGTILDVACHGPITRNVRDAALMMNVISGPDELDYTCIRTAPPDFLKELDGSLKKMRIAWSPDLGYAEVDVGVEVKSIAETAAHAFEELGHEVEEATPAIESPFNVFGALYCAWTGVFIGALWDDHADQLAPYTRALLEITRELSGVEVAKAYLEVDKWRRVMLDFFGKYDLLMTPTTPIPAFPIGAKSKKPGPKYYSWCEWHFCPFTQIFNLTRNPAASVPCGFSSDGLPISLQIVGRQEDDVTVLRASAALEKVRPWADKHPPVS